MHLKVHRDATKPRLLYICLFLLLFCFFLIFCVLFRVIFCTFPFTYALIHELVFSQRAALERGELLRALVVTAVPLNVKPESFHVLLDTPGRPGISQTAGK